MKNTKIQWADSTINPIVAINNEDSSMGFHCQKISPACAHCYAEAFNLRKLKNAGTGLPYTVKSGEKIQIAFHYPRALQILRWTKAKKIFWCSMTDIFGHFVNATLLDTAFAFMLLANNHTHLILTKRPIRARLYLSDPLVLRRIQNKATFLLSLYKIKNANNLLEHVKNSTWPLPNVWLGTTAETQKHFDKRFIHISETPAAKRWVSLEPLLGDISIHRYAKQLDWIVVGGESGNKARPMQPQWLESIIHQHELFNIPLFFKQWGKYKPCDPNDPINNKCIRVSPLGIAQEDSQALSLSIMDVNNNKDFAEFKGKTYMEFPL